MDCSKPLPPAFAVSNLLWAIEYLGSTARYPEANDAYRKNMGMSLGFIEALHIPSY